MSPLDPCFNFVLQLQHKVERAVEMESHHFEIVKLASFDWLAGRPHARAPKLAGQDASAPSIGPV